MFVTLGNIWDLGRLFSGSSSTALATNQIEVVIDFVVSIKLNIYIVRGGAFDPPTHDDINNDNTLSVSLFVVIYACH